MREEDEVVIGCAACLLRMGGDFPGIRHFSSCSFYVCGESLSLSLTLCVCVCLSFSTRGRGS